MHMNIVSWSSIARWLSWWSLKKPPLSTLGAETRRHNAALFFGLSFHASAWRHGLQNVEAGFVRQSAGDCGIGSLFSVFMMSFAFLSSLHPCVIRPALESDRTVFQVLTLSSFLLKNMFRTDMFT